jgi:hypothetical protein
VEAHVFNSNYNLQNRYSPVQIRLPPPVLKPAPALVSKRSDVFQNSLIYQLTRELLENVRNKLKLIVRGRWCGNEVGFENNFF